MRKTCGECYEEFKDDPLFRDCDLLGYPWKLLNAVQFIANHFPEYTGTKRRTAIRNSFLSLGGKKKGDTE